MAGHTSMLLVDQKRLEKQFLLLFLQVKSFYTDIVGGVRVKEGRHVDEVDGHHVEVGVDVLPNRKRRRCYSGL